MAENFDQTRTRAPFTTVDGTETIVLNQGGLTKGGFLSVLRTWILDSLTVVRSQISDATAFGRDLLGLADATALNDLIVHPTPYLPPVTATSEELELGTETDERMFTPSLIVEAIAFHTAPKNPQAIEESIEITEDEVGGILVCDAADEIDITLPELIGLQRGAIQVINLATDPVSIVTDGTTLIDGTGTIVDKTVIQYEHAELIYLGDNTWYVREQ